MEKRDQTDVVPPVDLEPQQLTASSPAEVSPTQAALYECEEPAVVTDQQVKKLRSELEKHGQVGRAAMKAGMDRKTARKYLKAGKLPSELKAPRTWRTRPDPFEEIWPEVESALSDAPELESKTLFEAVMERHPEKFSPGQLRTFQRRVRDWRVLHGPEREVFFPQVHRPGEQAQTDFTYCGELQVTIAGDPLDHLLCHVVLPFSLWSWATVCFSESLLALRKGVQAAFFRLGHTPKFHQTDNSSAATHRVGRERAFNEGYLALMRHLDMEPRTIAVGKKEQNGSVEAMNGALKRRLKQHLLIRGSRDFESLAAYQAWLDGVMEQANRQRAAKVEVELKHLKALRHSPLPLYEEHKVNVTAWSTVRVKRNTYSVPSRLIGSQVRVRVHEERIEVYYKRTHLLTAERLRGAGRHRINYRHIIRSLVRKPGAFERYRYREELFPCLIFRRAYDALCEQLSSQRKADVAYLRLLQLAATTVESDVAAALECLLEAKQLPLPADVKALVVAPRQLIVPYLEPLKANPAVYNALLEVAS